MFREKNSDLWFLRILVLSWIEPNQGLNTSPWASHCWTPGLVQAKIFGFPFCFYESHDIARCLYLKTFLDIIPHTTKITKIPSTWCFPHLVTFVRFALFAGTDFVIRDRLWLAVTVTGASYVRAPEPGPTVITLSLVSPVSAVCLCRHCFTFTGEFCTPGVMTGQSYYIYIPVHSIH